jgi:hypothetical protein
MLKARKCNPNLKAVAQWPDEIRSQCQTRLAKRPSLELGRIGRSVPRYQPASMLKTRKQNSAAKKGKGGHNAANQTLRKRAVPYCAP